MSENLKKLIDQIGNLTLNESFEVIESLKEHFGIDESQLQMGSGGSNSSAQNSGEAEVKEEKSEFNIIIEDAGEKKIEVIKEVRAITGLGLKEAKDLAETNGGTIKENVKKEEAEEIKKKLEAAGAKVTLK